MTPRRPVISVIGDARIEDAARVEQARQLGAALIRAEFRIVTGGLGGVMEAVCRGAREAPEWREGLVVGIIPSYRATDANAWCDVVIPSGMQLARNVLVVSSGDVIVALGGGSGTLSEIALAWQLGKPIVALGEDGWSGRLAGLALDERSRDVIHACATVEEVVDACRRLVATAPEPGDIGARWRAHPGGS